VATGIEVSGDGRFFAEALEQSVCIYSSADGKRSRKVRVPEPALEGDFVRALAITARGDKVAASWGDARVFLLDVKTGKVLHRLRHQHSGHRDRVASLDFSPDGSVLAVGLEARDLIRLWDVAQGERARDITRGPNRDVRAPREEEEKWPRAGVKQLRFSPDGHSLAAACLDGTVRLWEVATGGLRHKAAVEASILAFSPDGALLATARFEAGTVQLWDWRGLGPDRKALTNQEMKTLWASLAEEDASAGYRAMGRLLADREKAVAWLGKSLTPVAGAGDKEVKRLIADLDGDRQVVQDRARARLTELGRVAEAELRAALKGELSPDARRSARGLLRRLEKVQPGELATRRAVEVLERIGTSAARKVLRRVAAGHAAALETIDAKGAVRRLQARGSPKP
jgi:WD40 repeat protein